jgi:flagellar biosynthesis protein
MAEKKKIVREAVVLEYDPARGVPQVVAQGKGHVAERIISVAEENRIPIHEDPELAHMLNMLQIGDEIPPELYNVVAQVLIYVAKIDQKSGETPSAPTVIHRLH